MKATTIPYIDMKDGEHFFPRDKIELSIDEERLGSTETGDGIAATFPLLSTDPLPLRISWIEAGGGRVVCERDDESDGYVHLDTATFTSYAREGKIRQLTKPLYEGPHRFVNRHTELYEHILYSTPRRDTKTRQFGYLIESRRASGIEHLFLTEKELLNRAKPSEFHPEGVTHEPT